MSMVATHQWISTMPRRARGNSTALAAVLLGVGVASVVAIGPDVVGVLSPSHVAVPAGSTVPASPRVDWADATRPIAGSRPVAVNGGTLEVPAGAVVSTRVANFNGGPTTGVLFDADSRTLSVDATTMPGRYGVSLHVMQGGRAIASGYDEFTVR